MNNRLLAPFLLFSWILTSCDNPPPISMHCDVIVLENHWVTVEESIEQDFENASRILAKGESCLIKEGGCLAIIRLSADSAKVTYDSPDLPIGTACPIGAEFTLPISLLTEWGWKQM